jgi:hypothetical protein
MERDDVMPSEMTPLAQPAAIGGASGLIGIVLGLVGGLNVFVKRSEMDTAIVNARLQGQSELNAYKAEVAEKYITRDTLKEAIRPLEDNVEYIRTQIDSLKNKA